MGLTFVGVDDEKRVGDHDAPPMTSTRALALVLSAQHTTPNAPLATPWLTGAAEIEAALRVLGYGIYPAVPAFPERASR